MISRTIPGYILAMAAAVNLAGAVKADGKQTSEQLCERGRILFSEERYREAIPLLLRAGRMGDRDAQTLLGRAYRTGKGVRVDKRAAAYWFGQAAPRGDSFAMYALADMYEKGEGGLRQDPVEAERLRNQARNNYGKKCCFLPNRPR